MQSNDPTTPGEAQASGGQGGSAQAELEALKARIAELEASNGELRDTVLREKAEIENQRRRLHRDVEQARRFANEKLLNELLPVYDGLESGLQVEGGDVASMREGIALTLKSLLKVAENNGLVQVDPVGQPLDPEKHHAVSMVDAPGAAPNTVVNVLQKGYVLNDRLLRPALVAVAKD
ncbi:nucleotide exchange factor GrpE [Dyella solisilvae]|uniref:Protein GrpE n=1 Tax=Dyella solisilvae TaxID=1920168 RepID=A0A370KA72_9GAMM|nr:nucleotide exchange factor GrpE [Dyella solisilvae]RDI99543.1 nucleotide exchange factor GrpE [Dyella solisilvae]